MEQEEKIFCGSAKLIYFNDGNHMTKATFSRDDVQKLMKFLDDENKDWVSINIKSKKNQVEGKPTHYCEIDLWKRDENYQQPQQSQQPQEQKSQPYVDVSNDMPINKSFDSQVPDTNEEDTDLPF